MDTWKMGMIAYLAVNTLGTAIWAWRMFNIKTIKVAWDVQQEMAEHYSMQKQMRNYNIGLIFGMLVGIIVRIIAWLPLMIWQQIAMAKTEREFREMNDLDKKRMDKQVAKVKENDERKFK